MADGGGGGGEGSSTLLCANRRFSKQLTVLMTIPESS